MPRETVEVIFFDAGGTLFEVRGSVGESYARIARAFRVAVDPTALEQEFNEAFRAQGPLAFPGVAGNHLEAAERAWWFQVVEAVFRERMEPPQLKAYFSSLYAHFRRAEAWHLFPDVRPALQRLRNAGYRLGIVSNFDSRLDQILVELGIARYFERVVVSSRAGAAKPDPAIFLSALAAFGVTPDHACHVGDTPREDIFGAKAAGVEGILLDRRGEYPDWSHGVCVTGLNDLARLLK